MATDPQTLLGKSNCYACYGIPEFLLFELSLLGNWYNNLTPPVVLQPQVQTWVTQARANGGNPSNSTISAVNTFWVALQTAGIDSKMLLVNPLAPDDWNTLLTPLVPGNGFTKWFDIGGILQPFNTNISKGISGNATGAINTGFLPAGVVSPTNDVGM